MTTLVTGAAGLSSQNHRQQTAILLQPMAAGTLQVRGGYQSGLTLTKTTGMGFQVDPGRAVVPAAAVADGAFAVTVIDAVAGSFAPGDATRDRIDIVAISVDPTQAETAAATPVVIQGAYPSSGSPVAPTVPAGQLGLWQVTIKAGTSAGNGGWDTTQKTDLRKRLTAVGGHPIVASQSERDALTTYEGLKVVRLDYQGAVDTYAGGSWNLSGIRRHAELTAGVTNYPQSAGAWGPGMTTADAAHTWNNDFCTPATDGATMTKAGLYLFQASWTGNTAAPPALEMVVKNTTQNGTWLAANSSVSGGPSWTCTLVTVGQVNANDQIVMVTQGRAAAWDNSARLKITRLAD